MKYFLFLFMLLGRATVSSTGSSVFSANCLYTQYITKEELEIGEWLPKITDTVTLDMHFVELVTQKEKDDYNPKWICLQIFDKNSKEVTQIIDLEDYFANASILSSGDFNFDGFTDIEIFGQYYAGPNVSSYYFLYDPEEGTFFDSGFDGTSMIFHDSDQTIYSINQCCAGTSIIESTYKVVNNKMVLIEEIHSQAAMDEDGAGPLLDDDGNLIYNETIIRYE